MDERKVKQFIEILSNHVDPVSLLHSQFQNLFSFEERIDALTKLSILLAERLLDHCQQIAAAWFIYAEFEDAALNENPFASVFSYINEMCANFPNTYSPSLCDLIPIILSDTPLDFLRTLSIHQILLGAFSAPNSTPKFVSDIAEDGQRISSIIIQEEENENTQMEWNDILYEILTSDLISTDYEPPYIRNIPELTPVFEEEIKNGFIISDDSIPFLFDSAIIVNSKEAGIVLLQRATESKLRDDEASGVLSAITKFPSIIESTDFSKDKLASLIENNPNIAKEFFTHYVKTHGDILDFLKELPVSVSTVEVVKHLVMSGIVSDDFLQNYIIYTIQALSQTRDQQTMLKTRLFCRFMSFLQTHSVQFRKEVMIELQPFCLEFSTKGISEAQDLFQLLVS